MRVAVVIVSKDDPRIHPCLEAVFGQDHPDAFEVVVVDNGSEAKHVDDVRTRWGTRPNFRVVVVPGSFSAAWNQGAFATTVDVVARLDGDTTPRPDWLSKLVAPFRSRPEIDWSAGAVVGPTPLRSLTQRYFHHRTVGYQGRLVGSELPTDAVPSWNVAYRLPVLRKVGGYDPWQRSSIDWDLHKRLARRGHRGVFVPEAVLVHDHPARLRDFYRKEAWYRTGHYQMMLKYGPGAVVSSFLLPFAYLALIGILVVGSLVDDRILLAGGVLLVLLLLKQWWTAVREKDPTWWTRPWFRLVEATAALHGLLRGFFKFGLRRRPIPNG